MSAVKEERGQMKVAVLKKKEMAGSRPESKVDSHLSNSSPTNPNRKGVATPPQPEIRPATTHFWKSSRPHTPAVSIAIHSGALIYTSCSEGPN